MPFPRQHLDRFRKDTKDFIGCFITMDYSWVYHHDPESKPVAREWCESDTSVPKWIVSRNRLKRCPFFRVQRKFCSWITSKLVKQYIQIIIFQSAGYKNSWGKGLIYRRKKYFFCEDYAPSYTSQKNIAWSVPDLGELYEQPNCCNIHSIYLISLSI